MKKENKKLTDWKLTAMLLNFTKETAITEGKLPADPNSDEYHKHVNDTSLFLKEAKSLFWQIFKKKNFLKREIKILKIDLEKKVIQIEIVL